ncbi:hypothetical protein C2S53_011545 [Perilla frutescens var. hirtella]|uniref:SAWADEE domain-containing protein n=1 Tax=Perilla frutescens var. hirtella TaxID=608512 RepID=A0AAD4J8U6_PERFH|nr:hypothetical protein C2S53_011545 [Perilla frutescens var. hirtella]
MGDALMASVDTSDSASLYDLEYRATEDDAWYSVCVVLDAGAETLSVKYMCAPEVYEVVFSAGDFETEARLEELVGRFRPVSRQLQDCECLRLSIGKSVCAGHRIGDNDLRFYDAVVDAVENRPHSFAGGEEECLCTFVLYWQHGRVRGTLTSVNIASICVLEPATQIDPRICAFAKMAKKKIKSLKELGMKSETSMKLERRLTYEAEDSAKISYYDQWTSHDEDMGPKSCNSDGSATTDGHFFILIDNLEKDLTPSAIENFIYEKTTILPEACVFPRQLSDPFARGAIMVDCQKKAQTIHEFLDNPNHFVVSSRGRPWVVTEKALARTFGASIWNLIPVIREEIKPNRTCREVEVVVSGTDAYQRAKQLRDLFLEFIHHESQVFERLVLEEEKILQSYQPA